MEDQIPDIETEIVKMQMEVCRKHNAEFMPTPFRNFIGVALESFETFQLPVNGLRHPIENVSSSNWYIWCGDYSERDDFFKPMHVEHLFQVCPKALKFLGLGPGWRFLFDNIYEDVWFDETLLRI